MGFINTNLALQILLSIVNLQIHIEILGVRLKHGDKKVLNLLCRAVLIRKSNPHHQRLPGFRRQRHCATAERPQLQWGKADILCILNDEFTRIKADPKLKHLL
ncbi:MAG: hypothetical protein RRY36_07030 [Bacteroidaceae bacterium]